MTARLLLLKAPRFLSLLPFGLCLGLLLCPLLKELRLKLGRANEVFHLQAIEHMVDDVLLLFALGDGHSSDVF